MAMLKPVRFVLGDDKYRGKLEISSTSSSPRVNPTRSSKEFTIDDVISICSDIAEMEGIVVKLPTSKASMLRRFSADFARRSLKRVKSGNGSSQYQCKSADGSPRIYAKSMSELRHVRVKDNVVTQNMEDKAKSDKENIPGLRGREVISIAILVDNQGTPITTYTERDDIPSEEYDAANEVFISRVPLPEKTPGTPTSPSDNNFLNVKTFGDDLTRSVKSLSDFLTEDMDAAKGNKLKKHMSDVLLKLRTTDLATAKSFLKADRYANVRNAIKTALLHFVEEDLKMTILSEVKQ